MKRTLLLTMDFPPMVGGVAAYWANLSKSLHSDDFVVLSSEYDNSLDFDIEQHYLIYRRNLLTKNKWLWPKWLPFFFSAARIVRREKIEKIIVAQVLPGGTIAYLLSKFYRIPYIISFHGLDLALAQRTKHKRRLLNLIVKHAQTILVNSEFTKEKLQQLESAKDKRVEVVYPCPHNAQEFVDDKKLNKFLATRKQNHKLILTVGRLIERKGHDKVIEALPEIIKKVPGARYVIVGRGQEKDRLERLAKDLNVSQYIKIHDDVIDEEIPYFYLLSDIFVMPCRTLVDGDVEGFGIVYLEANSYGVPAIAGRSGGAVEAVEHNVNGLVVNPENSNEIAQAIISLLQNPQKAEHLGLQGKKRVETKFNWKEQAQKLLTILNQ